MTDRTRVPREDVATRVAAGAFLLAIASSVALGVIYFGAGGNTPLEGFFLFLAFASIAVALVLWTKVVIDEEEVFEERPPMRSDDSDRLAFQHAWEGTRPDAEGDPRNRSRRRFLTRMLTVATVSLTGALLIPFRSLGPSPRQSLVRTDWREGVRLVGDDGEPIRPARLEVGSIETVFPQGRVGDADAQAILIRVGDELDLPVGSPPTVGGFVAYSKICTHAACPVGLYRAEVGELLCPCHQSKFDAFRGARPISGPTVRPLPQLPLDVDDEGFFVALGDFEAPVGPGFWNLDDDQVGRP